MSASTPMSRDVAIHDLETCATSYWSVASYAGRLCSRDRRRRRTRSFSSLVDLDAFLSENGKALFDYHAR